MIDILIVNDNRYREQFSTELLFEYLKKDLIVRVVSKSIFRTAIQLLRPQAVVVPRVQTDFHDIFEFKEKYKFQIFFIPVEHSGGNENGILSFLKTYLKKNTLDENHSQKLKLNINKVFVAGEFYKDILLKHNLFNESQIIITGTPSSDLWFQDINSIFKKNKKKTIGIATSFKSFMFGTRFQNVQQAIHEISSYKSNLIKDGHKKNQIDINNQKHDLFFLWYEMYQFIIINKIINDNKNINFSIRPHPMENIKNSKYYEKVTKNLSVDRNLILNEWISNQKIILSFGSTLLYDSYFSHIPSYSLRKFMPDNITDMLSDYLKPVYSNFPFQPENFDQLYEIINSNEIKEDQYFTQYTENKIIETSLPTFNFPRKKMAYIVIGDEIKNNLIQKTKTFIDKISLYFYSFIIILKQIKISNFSLRYKKNIQDKNYNPLKIFQNYQLKKYIKIILKL
tara:strand:- start:402 stop:1760 length:1359 start_codon:yes stop_codon:yes gene_type:complete